MKAKVENVVVRGISSYVPENVEDNLDFASLLGERRVKKQIRLTGIRKRHISVKFQKPSDLAAFAADRLISELGWNKEEIGILIFVTQGGDYIIPSTAICLQDRLGLPKDCVAFDINLGCSAFNYGVHTAANMLSNSLDYEKGLCLIGDYVEGLAASRIFNKDSISFSMLSGSAASVVALEKESGASMIFYGSCDGSNFDAIVKTSYWRDTMMKGNVVFDYAINDVSQSIIDFKQENFLSEDDIDYYVFHQAQRLMLDSVMNTCDLPEDKVLFSLEEYGNTSGASVPLTINANAEMLKKHKKVRLLLCGFGVGLSCGITYLEMKTDHITNVGESDKFYGTRLLPRERLHDLNILIFGADELLGEFLSHMLDESDASLILCGHDEAKLESLQHNLYRESNIISYTNKEEFAVKLEKIQDKRMNPIDGIVNITDDEIAQWMVDHGSLFSDQLSVVLTGTEEQIQMLDRYEQIFCGTIGNARVNMVCYKEDCMELYVQQEGRLSWGHRFLKNNLPSDMIRPNYLFRSIEFLLYRDSRFVSGSVIRISEKIKWS